MFDSVAYDIRWGGRENIAFEVKNGAKAPCHEAQKLIYRRTSNLLRVNYNKGITVRKGFGIPYGNRSIPTDVSVLIAVRAGEWNEAVCD